MAKSYILWDVPDCSRDFHGIKFPHNYADYAPSFANQWTTAIAWLHRSSHLYLAALIIYSVQQVQRLCPL